MKSLLLTTLQHTLLIFCFFTSFQIESIFSNNSFFNVPPTAICGSGQAQVDQDHDIPFTGSGAIFNSNGEGLNYPGQTITVGITGYLTRVDIDFRPTNITFGGTAILTVVDGDDPNPPQTVLATKTIVPNSVDAVFILDTPIPVTVGQQLTLLLTGTMEGGLVSDANDVDSYPGGDRWATNNGGQSWFGPLNEDINFVTYVSTPATTTISIGPGGIATVDPSVIDGGSTDDLTDSANLIFDVSPTSFDCFDLGSQSATLTVTDEGGLTSSCIATVIVNDENGYCCSAPVAMCKDFGIVLDVNGEATITPEDINDGSLSTCGLDMLELDQDFFQCLNLGTNVVTLTVTDINGNTDECTADVIVYGVPCGWFAGPDGINCTGESGASYNTILSSFTLSSDDCYNSDYYRSTDVLGYTWTSFCNDGYFMAEVTDVDGYGWGGIALREGGGSSDKMVQVMINEDNLIRREFRQTTGGTAFAHTFLAQGKNWLKIERNGSLFKTYRSADGNNWELISMANIEMNACIEAGLITMNDAPETFTVANFSNVMKFEVGALTAPSSVADIPAANDPSNSFSLFPNPTTGLITIDAPSLKEEHLNIYVFNSVGQLVMQKENQYTDSGRLRIDLNPYHNGIYLISINADGEQIQKKVVLEKF